MSQKSFERKNAQRSERWIEALVGLARGRGDSEAVASRAVQLSRQLNISPWIALAVAERLVTLKEAQLLDRVGRCRELSSAILDKRRTISELKVMMPYAAHFLAVELMDAHPGMARDPREVIRILEGVLGGEKKTGDDEMSFRVRIMPPDYYAAVVDRILAIMKRTRCDVGMAMDVDAGRLEEQFASDYVRQKRKLEIEERQRLHPAPEERSRFPQRRLGDERRAVFHRPEAPSRTPQSGTARDHWPREQRPPVARDHWPK
jgi:hypothetical protein